MMQNKKCTQSAPSGYLDIISRCDRNDEGELIYNGDGSTFVEIVKNGIPLDVIMANRADEMNFIEMRDTMQIVKIPDKPVERKDRLDMVRPVAKYCIFIPNSKGVKKHKKIKNNKCKGKTPGLSKKETNIRKKSRLLKYNEHINQYDQYDYIAYCACFTTRCSPSCFLCFDGCTIDHCYCVYCINWDYDYGY